MCLTSGKAIAEKWFDSKFDKPYTVQVSQSFAKELKAWRKSQPQKAVHELLGVKLVTYQSWEAKGTHNRTPNALALAEIRRRMARWTFK